MKKNASYMLRSFEVLCRNIIQNYTEKFIRKAAFPFILLFEIPGFPFLY